MPLHLLCCYRLSSSLLGLRVNLLSCFLPLAFLVLLSDGVYFVARCCHFLSSVHRICGPICAALELSSMVVCVFLMVEFAPFGHLLRVGRSFALML